MNHWVWHGMEIVGKYPIQQSEQILFLVQVCLGFYSSNILLNAAILTI